MKKVSMLTLCSACVFSQKPTNFVTKCPAMRSRVESICVVEILHDTLDSSYGYKSCSSELSKEKDVHCEERSRVGEKAKRNAHTGSS